MKILPRFSVALAACALPLLLCPGLTRAADDDLAARRTQAEALLHAMHTEQVLTNATGRVDQMVDRYSQSLTAQGELTPEQKATVQKAQDDAHATIKEQLSWDAVKSDFVQAYADAFTPEELAGLVTFYTSPIGQKLVEKQPAVTEKMGKLTQQKMMAVMPGLMQKIKDAAPKPTPAASPAPAPVVPAPAAPAAPAATPAH